MISKATANNWEKLGSDPQGKLAKRANKTRSTRRVVASGYLDYAPAYRLLDTLSGADQPIGDIMYSLCVSYLQHAGIWEKENVKAFFSTLPDYRHLDIDLPPRIWDSTDDVLGFVYQSLTAEGERNMTGLYYTNRKVVEYMLDGKTLSKGETFLDPCCGSGAFLLSVKAEDPSCLYGFDINPIAVMTAGTNLLVKYAACDFVPQVHCIDFLHEDFPRAAESVNIPHTYHNIYTNPPWGADKEGQYTAAFPCIKSKERASMVVVRSLELLGANGMLHAILPTSLLKVKAHHDIRSHILSNASIKRIDMFKDKFDGVFTDFFSIKMEKSAAAAQVYDVTTGNKTTTVALPESARASGTIVWECLSDLDKTIIEKLESRRHDDLTHSLWALGIVTGDNKKKVKKEWASGLEPVYMGRQVSPFKLQHTTSYISFIPETFQQCAREEMFRAPEKLIYRFIAKYPIVAYDNQQRLCLNSANILIPLVDGLSIKSVAALLNSSLYHYYYSMKFPDIKVLKGNLQQLPFPKLTARQDKKLSRMVTSFQSSGHPEANQRALDKAVYDIFDITPSEQIKIQEYEKISYDVHDSAFGGMQRHRHGTTD